MRYTVLGALAEQPVPESRGWDRGESNTVDAHDTTVSLES